MPPHMFSPLSFVIELVFTILAVFFCALIYFKTKDIYELTKHKGIKYFRDSFLFFGLSYVLRFVFGLIMLSTIAFDLIIPRDVIGPLFILPLGYFSTIGILYLISSSIWKRFNTRKIMFAGHMIAILLSVASFVTRSSFILLLLQCSLLVLVIIISFLNHGKTDHITKTKILYFLIAGLWLVNLLIVDNRRPIPFGVDIFFEISSLVVFYIIFLKISKWLR
jgi:hypothetical protein